MDRVNLVRKKVYDPVLRLSHLLIGLSFLGLAMTGWGKGFFEWGEEREALWTVHISFGYLFILGLAVRLLWGLIGHKYARWSELWHWNDWLQTLKTRRLNPSEDFGHDKNASLAYVGFYVLAILVSITGLALAGIEQGVGPLAESLFDSLELKQFFEEPHEIGAIGIGVFVFIHLVAMLLHEKFEGVPRVQAMFSGYQYRKDNPKEEE